MAEMVELLLSLVLAILIGAPLMFLVPSLPVGLLVYGSGIAFGVIGSNLASTVRRRRSIKQMQTWARQTRSVYHED